MKFHFHFIRRCTKPNPSYVSLLHHPRFLHNKVSSQSPTQLNNLLNTTSQTKNIDHVVQIHTQIITKNYTSLPFLFNNLLNSYAKCGLIDQSLLLFATPYNVTKNVVTWTSVITQLSHYNKPFKALNFFNEMRRTGVYPNEFTFSAILSACVDTMMVVHGIQIHCLIIKDGFESDVVVGSSLVDMYAKYSDLSLAEKLFDEMPERNLVTYNSMIVGSLVNKCYDQAIGWFREVLREDSLTPDQVTISSALSACAGMNRLEFGRQIHGIILKYGLTRLAYVRNSLLDMYCKCRSLIDAVTIFESAVDKDVVMWNVMIAGCVCNDKFEEAIRHFWMMRSEGLLPDEASFCSVLQSAAGLSTFNQGALIHGQVIKDGFGRHNGVEIALITMYAKCGSLADARKIFEESKNRTVVIWGAIIAAFQQHGQADQAIMLFEDMLREGIKPDYITLVSVLSACSHAGRVDEGFFYFDSMTEKHGIIPGHEHYACMVDLLGRCGRLDEAKKFIDSIPIKSDSSAWGALLGACSNRKNLELGEEAANMLFELEPENPGNYVLLCNLYSHAGRLREADEIRMLMGVHGVRKEPGCSWIDVQNATYVFTSHDRSHSMANEMYEMLGELEERAKKKGYVPDVEFAVNSIGEYKEQSLWYHSEKLALAFGLLTLPKGAPIRIRKNLRTCGDCHTVMKFASEIFEKEIIVRDINRFHRFVNGQCSCRDFW